MVESRNSKSRVLSVIFLGIAVLMLVLGQTVLAKSLHKQAFIFYWLACFIFTGLAAIAAIADFFTLRKRVRSQQRKIMEEVFTDANKK